MKNGKYFIVLFCNKKRVKILYRCMTRNTVYEYWREFKTEKKPSYVKQQGGKRDRELVFELALVFPNNRWATTTWVKDSLGRNEPALIEGGKFRFGEKWQNEKRVIGMGVALRVATGEEKSKRRRIYC